MLNLASYNLIKRQWHVWNPSDLYCALKYHHTEDLLVKFQKARVFPEYELLYETILKVAREGNIDLEMERDLTMVDNCLKSLKRHGYIECHYRTKFDLAHEVTGIKIVDLSLTNMGEALLNSIQSKKTLDEVAIVTKCLEKMKHAILDLNILDYSSQALGIIFSDLCEEVADESFLSFFEENNEEFYMDYSKGMLVVRDFQALVKFIRDYNNFELEDYIGKYIKYITFNMIDLKIILNALKMNEPEMIYSFMEESKLISHLSRLLGMDYCRLDYFYYDVSPEHFTNNLVINESLVTQKGIQFLEDDHIIRLRSLDFVVTEIRSALQQASHQRDYEKFIRENSYLNKIMIIEKAE
jgi:hypothetical protein